MPNDPKPSPEAVAANADLEQKRERHRLEAERSSKRPPPAEPVRAGLLISERFAHLVDMLPAHAQGVPPTPAHPPGMITRLEAERRGVPVAHLDRLYQPGALEANELEDSRALRGAARWHASPSLWCLVLWGRAGRGKSLAASWVATRYGRPATWTSAEDYVQAMRGDRYAARRCVESTVLVIDDLGDEYLDAKGFAAHAVSRLISERWDRKLRTVVTTNLEPGASDPDRDLHRRYGDRVARRLNEGAILECTGPLLGGQS